MNKESAELEWLFGEKNSLNLKLCLGKKRLRTNTYIY